ALRLSIPTSRIRSVLLRRLRETLGELTERHQREVRAVHPVTKIEVARESGTGEFLLEPESVGLLRSHEILDGANELGAHRLLAVEQCEDAPGGLRRGAVSLARERWVVVRAAVFAEPAVRVLHRLEPRDRAADRLAAQVLAERAQPREHGPGAVDVVD